MKHLTDTDLIENFLMEMDKITILQEIPALWTAVIDAGTSAWFENADYTDRFLQFRDQLNDVFNPLIKNARNAGLKWTLDAQQNAICGTFTAHLMKQMEINGCTSTERLDFSANVLHEAFRPD